MPINDVQTTNRQHAVPQNIMDVEFKIIGDLTMRQFIYLMIFSAIAYGIFIVMPSVLKWPLIMLCVLAGVAFAFLPIEERGLDQWVINFFKSMYQPNQRIWRKEAEIPTAFSFENINMVKQELITLTPTSSRRKLEEFLDKQEYENSAVDPLDIQEFAFADKLRDAFATVSSQPEATPVVAPKTQPTLNIEDAKTLDHTETKVDREKSQMEDKKPDEQKTQEHKEVKQEQEKTENEKSNKDFNRGSLKEHINNMRATSQKEEKKEPVRHKLLTPIQKQPEEVKVNRAVPITPDRHTGRKFTNLLPKQGEIILPIRGEKILQTLDEQKIEDDIEDKANQLKALLEQIKTDEKYSTVVSQNKEVAQEVNETVQKAQEVVNEVKNEQNDNKGPMENTQSNAPQPAPPSDQSTNTNTTPQPPQNIPNPLDNMPPKQASPEAKPAQTANISPLSTRPNVISGEVKDNVGKPIEGLVLIIKNEKDEPVRALKTNQVGQFSISTPLSNGKYTIETDKSKKTSFSFDIISFEATGAVIPPVEITGRI